MAGTIDYIKITGTNQQSEDFLTALRLLQKATDILVSLDEIHQHQYDDTLTVPDNTNDTRYSVLKDQYGISGDDAATLEGAVSSAVNTLTSNAAITGLLERVGV